MSAINEIGRNVMQGGSRRSAIYASLNWQHEDIPLFLGVKNWDAATRLRKEENFNSAAPLDMTNISVNYDDAALTGELANNPVFLKNVRQAMETGEPGFSFNFGDKQNETLRNACTEVTSEDDSDVCNLGSINLGNIKSLDEFKSVVTLASKFLVCGTLRADLPYDKVYRVREKNRRLGLGLMGIHEWLLQRGSSYEVTPELHTWLGVYKDESKRAADEHCDRFYISRPVAYRAIAPTGTIGILASTTTGIEPLFAVAYKRRYLTNGTQWKYEYVVDATAERIINEYGVKAGSIDTAYSLSSDYERRIKFQADIQDYVDMSISSTINLPAWGTKDNCEAQVERFANTLAKYAPRLRGFTAYPDGSRGGQPITEVPYEDAVKHKGIVYQEHDVCDITGHGGSCGV
jgi:ribonucleoside-diphosphate reductase alpha chain